MSQKGKRPSQQQRPENDGDPPVKRRKGRPPGSLNKDHSKNAAASTSSSSHHHHHHHNQHNVDGNENNGDNSYGNTGLSLSQAQMAVASTSKSWQPKPHNDLKSIYNRSAPEAPAELFRKDLISAMKLPDSEPLSPDEYWLIVDQWKQEWERGVQVPVNPDSLPEASVNNIKENYIQRGRQDFKLPKNKYIRITKDESFSHEQHYLSHTPAMADSVCAYDLDQCDEAWLKICNGERALAGLPPISDSQFERVVEELEVRCWDKIQSIMKNEEGLGIEFDENVICDVCRSPDSEEANEMVFCDNCNICVHQACYGITAIPSGQWLCRTCTTGIKPDCVLCPNKGGAMKSTRSGTKWAHVSCALWIPEVSIGSVDRMEPITKISNIPQSRWALNCILCREKVGACIQCSVKTCKTAYHVTCAFQHGLEMRAIIEDEHNEDGVKLRSYCQKHSTTKTKKEGKSHSNKVSTATGAGSGTDEDDHKRRRTRKEMTTEERNQVRAQRLSEIESEFHKHVNIKDISCHLLDIDQEGINYIYNYWILKRKSGSNRPLLPPKNEDAELASQKEENQEQEKMRMFVQLRQDLERVRNLCYMVSRREKLSRSFFKLREQTFHKQVSILADLKFSNSKKLDDSVLNAVIEANHGPSIYDKLYSSDLVNLNKNSNSEIANNIDVMLDRLINSKSSSSSNNRNKSPRQAISSLDLGSNSSLDKINMSPHKSRQNVDINGINNNNKKNLSSSKTSSASATVAATTESRHNSDNPYKRTYFNGTTTSRRSASLYSSTGISSDSDHSRRRTLRGNLSATSSEDESNIRHSNKSATPITVTSPSVNKSQSTKVSPRRRSQNVKSVERKRRRDAKQESATNKYKSNSIIDTSSEDEENQRSSKRSPRNRTLQQMEKELHDERSHLSDSTDSDELTGICFKPTSYSQTKVSNAIYSDSDSTDKDKTDNTASDSQQHPFRTKAAMKEFNINALTSTTTSPLAKVRQSMPKGILKNAGEKSLLSNVTNVEHEKSTSKENSKGKSKSKSILKKNDFPADLLVVPQRQAAKKASENLMRTNVPVVQQMYTCKKENKSDAEVSESKLSRVLSVDELEKKSEKRNLSKSTSKSIKRQESKDNSSDRESKSNKNKEESSSNKKDDSSIIDLLPYVPQRQAAKKAAEHIKSTVLKPSEAPIVVPAEPETKVSTTKKNLSSNSSKKEDTGKKGVSESSSSESESSSSSSSSGSASKSSSSSSEESEPSPPQKVSQKRHSSNSNRASVVSRRTSDKSKDLPFLDKGNKSAGTVFCSSESESDSKSSSNESIQSQKQIPGKITKRKSSSAATSVSLKSSSSGVGTSTGTNTTSGRPRGRPRTKSIFKETDNSSKSVRSSSEATKEIDSKIITPKKDESKTRRPSTSTNSNNTTPTKATARGRRDSKVQISENATPSSRRRPSDISPRIADENTDVKTRRRSTRQDSLTSPIKDKTSSITTESRLSSSKKDEDESKSVSSSSTRKRKLSPEPTKEAKSKSPTPITERQETKDNFSRETTPVKTDKTNEQASVITLTKCDTNEIKDESKIEDDHQLSLRDKTKSPEKEIEVCTKDSEEKPPEKLSKSPIKKSTRTSSDMEIDPMNSPPYVAQITQSTNLPESVVKSPEITTNSINLIDNSSKNNGPKSIFDLTDDLTEANETHFEVPPTPLTFTSHHTDWLKIDANEDTQKATLDLVEKLYKNKYKKQNQSDSLVNNDEDLSKKKDLSSIETDKNESEDVKSLEIDSIKQSSSNDNVFDKPLEKLNSCKESQNFSTSQEIQPQKQTSIIQNQTNSQMGSPSFNQDVFMYGRRWNESEIIARRRSVSSSPASTVSDNTELQQHLNQSNQFNDKNQMQLNTNIPTLPQQMKMNQQHGQMQAPLIKNALNESHQMQTQQSILPQNQIPLQINHNQNMSLHGQHPMVQFPSHNQNQILPQEQHRPFKPESCMFYNQSKQAVGLQPSPTYQMGQRPSLFPNTMPVGNKAEEVNRNINMQHGGFRQNNSNSFNMTNTNMTNNPNISLTASMGSPTQETIKIKSSPQNHKNMIQSQDIQTTNVKQQLPPPIAPITDVNNIYSISNAESKKPPQSTVSLAELKKSPAKTVPKLSVRNTYQQNIENMQNQIRSPHLNTKMSPGKSPRQMDMISKQVNAGNKANKSSASETASTKRQRSNSTKNTGQSNRGRNSTGSKKGRGKNLGPFNDLDFGGTNHSNLAGTAYDLDLVEEENFTLENFRTSLSRDRKKSNDTSNLDYLRSREPSQSPKFSSPKNRSLYSSAANTPTAATTPSGNTPLHQGHHPLMAPDVNTSTVNSMTPTSTVSSLHEMVLPVLPGPVDMRTYNSNFDSSTNNEIFNNHLLGAFDSGTADHTLADIDEEMEKELQSALKASNSKAKEISPPVSSAGTEIKSTNTNQSSNTSNSVSTTAINTSQTTTTTSVLPSNVDPPEDVSVDSDTMRISFSDSRNQLKFKIKGPLAPDNYSSTTIIHKIVETSASMTATVPIGGTPGHRRMRKKELLRQYWTQDANVDDQTSASFSETNTNIAVHSMPNRVAGIPKAVDSMSSIPTKEDYKDYTMADTKKRKKVSSLQRELRQLTGALDEETSERRRSVGNASDKSSNASTSGRSRLNRSGPPIGQTPKLKIKLGSNIYEPTGVPPEEFRQSDRPPKKRRDNYSFEDFRRDSMHYREQVFADFKKKKEKSEDIVAVKEKKKKKKDKEKKRKVEVIENNQKFVLKIKKTKLEAPPTESTEILKPEPTPNQYDPNAEDPLSVSTPVTTGPLKIKLARTVGPSGSYTLAIQKDKQAKPKTSKKQNNNKKKVNASNDKPKSKTSNVAPIKKRELTECRLTLEKLDQDTIQKFVSKTSKTTDESLAHPNDSQLGAATNSEINNSSNITNSSSISNNLTNINENNTKDEPINIHINANSDEQKMVQPEKEPIEQDKTKLKQKSENSEKDCEVR
uniref:PHD finger protein rhinoceros n=1 Tax=Culicoides sonorensis TaxID=179676 RepID=A0A336MGX5_CULSO